MGERERVSREAVLRGGSMRPADSAGSNDHGISNLDMQRSRGGGAALDGPMRAKYEARLGVDLGGVRVHTNDARAASLGARAYTTGRDVHLGPGRATPRSPTSWCTSRRPATARAPPR